MQVQLENYSDYLLKVASANLLPIEIFNQLPELDSQILESDPMVYLKIVDEYTDDILYIIEASKTDDDIELFGYLFNPLNNEMSEVTFDLSSLVNQIDTIMPYKRDESFIPCRLSEARSF